MIKVVYTISRSAKNSNWVKLKVIKHRGPSSVTSHEEGRKDKKINYIDVIVSHSADVHTYNYLIFNNLVIVNVNVTKYMTQKCQK